MTREERNTKLKNLITCLKCEESGRECDANCHVQYEAGNMGEIIENLEAISKALEQEPCDVSDTDVGKIDAVNRQAVINAIANTCFWLSSDNWEELINCINSIPSVNPQYTENEIQKMQDLEQAEIEKAYELGKAEGQKSEDVISRQAAIDALGEKPLAWVEGEYELGLQNQWENDVNAIKTLLPAQPKTGHWIRMKAYEKWGCSECNTVFRFTFKEHDYCPNCGAKMVEPQERSDEG